MSARHIRLEGYRARNSAMRHLAPTVCGLWASDEHLETVGRWATCDLCTEIDHGCRETPVVPTAAEPILPRRPDRERLEYVWWCEEHDEIHDGDLTMWSMEHREKLHPVYVHWRN